MGGRAPVFRVRMERGTGSRVVERAASELWFGRGPDDGGVWVIAEDPTVSRRQLRLEHLGGAAVRVEVIGRPVRLADGRVVETGAAVDVEGPIELTVGQTRLLVTLGAPRFETVERPVMPSAPRPSLRDLGPSPDAAALAAWFEGLLAVLAASAGGEDFDQRAARAVVELMGLDRGLVLAWGPTGWTVAGRATAAGHAEAGYSTTLLQRVREEARTFYEVPTASAGESLLALEAVVAAPVLGPDGAVVGAVYGARDAASRRGEGPLGPFEARLVQVIAAAVSAGRARVEQEEAAARIRGRFEQFFSGEVAAALERDPALLHAAERELTLLFVDVRGFSGLAERLAPATTYALMAELLDALTVAVHGTGGVVVDYYGDGLEAMWNAPNPQPDHARRACATALEMHRAVAEIAAAWAARVGGAVRVGVGIHTGRALVGNAGSRTRVKYGPRGAAVNLASRVEGATKELGVATLLTADTVARAGADLSVRPVGTVALRGLAEPVALFELLDASGGAAPVDG